MKCIRYFFPILTLSLVLSQIAFAQTTSENLNSKYITRHNNVVFKNQNVIEDLTAFNLNKYHSLKKAYSNHSKNDLIHTRYHQFYKNLRVLNGTIIYHAKNDILKSTSGKLYHIEDISTAPKITVDEAEKCAQQFIIHKMKQENISVGRNVDLSTKNTYYAIADIRYPKESGQFCLVYVMNVVGGSNALPVDYEVFVNAQTNEVISAISKIESTNIEGHGDGFYHKNITFNVDSLAPNEYVLRDLTRGNGIFAFNVLNEDAEFTDDDNEWFYDNEIQTAAIEGYYAAGKYYDFLLNKFERNSIDGNGTELFLNVNIHNYVNAYWNGSSATFGTGNCHRYNPLTSIEVVAHEFTHGLTDYTSNLVYRDESGALNESISDIFAKGCEYYYDFENFNWLIGGNLPKNASINPFRSMSNPHERFDPKFYKGQYWQTGTADAGGVHSNSGVFNHWFYLLVEGATGANELGYEYQVNSIGMEDAIQLVYHMQTNYLTENSGYFEAFEYSLASAEDLFGQSSPILETIIEAWKVVGIDAALASQKLLNLYTLYLGGNTFGQAYCKEVFQNFELSFRNESDSILSIGTLINGQIIYSYSNDMSTITDTIQIDEIILSEQLDLYEMFTTTISIDIEGDPTDVSIKTELDIVDSSNTEFKYFTEATLPINYLTTVEFNTYISRHGNTCFETADVLFDYALFNLPVCEDLTGHTLDFIFEGALGNDQYQVPLEEMTNSRYSLFYIIDEIDIFALGPINTVDFRIEYYDGIKSEILFEDSYAKIYGTTIYEPTTYSFENPELDIKELTYEGCQQCNIDFSQGDFMVKDTLSFTTLENCIPEDEYIKNMLVNGSNSFSLLGLCVDLISFSEPVLAFDLKQIDHPAYSAADNNYIHMVDVFIDGRSILNQPISSTNNEYQSFEIPLEHSLADQITIGIVSLGTSTFIDNIGLKDGLQVGVKNKNFLTTNITYNNPVNDILYISSNVDVLPNMQICLLDLNGQIVIKTDFDGTKKMIDMSSLSSGLYLIQVNDGHQFSAAQKVVKTN